MKDFPSRKELSQAILKILQESDGEMSTTDINSEVVDFLQLPKEIVELEDESGIYTKLDYRLRWCRSTLKKEGRIINTRRGFWRITNEDI